MNPSGGLAEAEQQQLARGPGDRPDVDLVDELLEQQTESRHLGVTYEPPGAILDQRPDEELHRSLAVVNVDADHAVASVRLGMGRDDVRDELGVREAVEREVRPGRQDGDHATEHRGDQRRLRALGREALV